MLKRKLGRDGVEVSALGMGCWAIGPAMIPIPGFKSVAQVEENAGALDFGPLSAPQMTRIQEIIS